MRTYLGSLGCKLNQSEMDALAARLVSAGHQVVGSSAEAEICILNTCAVTHVAAQKSRQALRRLHRQNPDARLIVTGCYAELSPSDLQHLPGVELIAGNQDKDRLADIIANKLTAHWAEPSTKPSFTHSSALPHSRTRALIKIQDGCDNACTYCIIHVARGPQRSRSPEEVLAEIQSKLAANHKEIVLTGVHIGAYGRDAQDGGSGVDLWDLVERILDETSVSRLRLSSIEPWDLAPRGFDLWDDPRLCRHLHLPLQSGNDATLRRMGRAYTTTGFADLVAQARARIPDLAVTTDVIVGFPGETDREFAAGLSFVKELAFARVHVFPYSLRPGTPAATMHDQVSPAVAAERAGSMRLVAEAAARKFRLRFVGRTMDVLWESSRDGSPVPVWSGLTDNYLRVYTTSAENLANKLLATDLVDANERGLSGLIASSE